MALHYVESSALAKCYVWEVGSPWIVRLVTGEEVAVSSLVLAEISSVLARRTHEGYLTVEQRGEAQQRLLMDLRRFLVLDLIPSVVRRAADLLLASPSTLPLRTLDALHLASALHTFGQARRRGVAIGSFVSSDRRLLAAATWGGLAVVDPQDQP